VVDSYLPADLGAGLTRTALQQPMHELLWERFGIRLKRSVHTIRVARADVDIASLLGIALADPVLRIQSSVYLAGGKPIRWTENYFREDQYEYVAEMEWPAPTATSSPVAARARRGKK
jgi:GntR family transcriptional regulator